MSGDVSRERQRKANAKPGKNSKQTSELAGELAGRQSGRPDSSSSASVFTKLTFFVLLAAFVIASAVVYVDYKPGQLNAAYVKNVPAQTRQQLDEMAKAIRKTAGNWYEKYLEQRKFAVKLARGWIRGMKVGDHDLEHLLFADEVRDEKLGKAKEAAERIKDSVDQIDIKKAEEAAKMKAELETKNKAEEEARQKAALEAKKKADEETRKKAETEARKKADEEARRKAEEETKRKAVESRKKAEEEAKRKAEEETRKKAGEEAKKKAEEARKKAEEEAKRKAEEAKKVEEARKKAEAEAKKKAEEARKKAEEEARKQAEESRKKADAEAKKKAEEARKKAGEEAKRKAEEEIRKKAEEEEKKEAEEARKKAEAEAKKKAEEARKKAEQEAKRKAEEEIRKKAEEEAKRKAEAARKKADEEAKRRAGEEKRRKAEEEAKKEAEETRKKAKAEANIKAEEARKKAEEEEAKKKAGEEARKKAEEEAKRKAEEEARKKAEEEARKKSEEAKRKAEEEARKRAKEKAGNLAEEEAAGKPNQQQRLRGGGGEARDDVLDRLESDLEMRQGHRSFEEIVEECDVVLGEAQQGASSPRVSFLKGLALHAIAERERSNDHLEKAIRAFRDVLAMERVPDDLFERSAEKCVELMLFRGFNKGAIEIQRRVLNRFPGSRAKSNRLGTLHLLAGQNEEGGKVFEGVLADYPSDGYAAGHLGFVLKLETTAPNSKLTDVEKKETLERAVSLLDAGVRSGDEAVREGKFFLHLGDGYRRLGRADDADRVFGEAADRKAFLSFWQRSLYNVPGLRAQAVWPLAETGIAEKLTAIRNKWRPIRDEALALVGSGAFEPEGESLRDTGHWGQFELYRQGRKNAAACKRTPLTCRLVDAVPEIATNRRGQVKFSLMEAGTHVHPHSGPTNCRLRVHLALDVPTTATKETLPPTTTTRLRVADQNLSWSDGEMFVFDDSFDHEVWHDNPEKKPRLVLIMDLWHPDLSQQQRQTLPAI